MTESEERESVGQYLDLVAYKLKVHEPDATDGHEVALIRDCALIDVWASGWPRDQVDDHVSVLTASGGSRMGASTDAVWDKAAESARSADLARITRSLDVWQGSDDPVASLVLSVGHGYHDDRREWVVGRSSVRASVRTASLDGGLSEVWMGAAFDFVCEATKSIGALYGFAEMARSRELVPEEFSAERGRKPPLVDGETDSVVGIAPVFVVGPLALERLGGFDVLRRIAPVEEVRCVGYRDGREGAVVRVAVDHADYSNRVDAVLDFFGPYLYRENSA